MLELSYIASYLAMIMAYLLVGKSFWGLVKSNFESDIHSLVMQEQEKNGHFAVLLPKFSVIALWPLVAVIGAVFAVGEILRSAVTTP